MKKSSRSLATIFGWLGLVGGIVAASTVFPSDCGPSVEQAYRVHWALGLATPLAMALLGPIANRFLKLSAPKTVSATVVMLSLVTALVCVVYNGTSGLGGWPIAAIQFGIPFLVVIVATGVVVTSWRRSRESLQAWKSGLLGAIAIGGSMGPLALRAPRPPLDSGLARASVALIGVSWIALLVLFVVSDRFERQRSYALYRSAGDVESGDEPPGDPAPSNQHDGLWLIVGGLVAIFAAMALWTAPAPPPLDPPNAPTFTGVMGC